MDDQVMQTRVLVVVSTYLGKDGRQYVVITSTGGGFFGAPLSDDSIMAFALPR